MMMELRALSRGQEVVVRGLVQDKQSSVAHYHGNRDWGEKQCSWNHHPNTLNDSLGESDTSWCTWSLSKFRQDLHVCRLYHRLTGAGPQAFLTWPGLSISEDSSVFLLLGNKAGGYLALLNSNQNWKNTDIHARNEIQVFLKKLWSFLWNSQKWSGMRPFHRRELNWHWRDIRPSSNGRNPSPASMHDFYCYRGLCLPSSEDKSLTKVSLLSHLNSLRQVSVWHS